MYEPDVDGNCYGVYVVTHQIDEPICLKHDLLMVRYDGTERHYMYTKLG